MKLPYLPDQHSIRNIHRDTYFDYDVQAVPRADLENGKRYIGRILLPPRSRSLQAHATDFLFRIDDRELPKDEGLILDYPSSADIAAVSLSLLDANGEVVGAIHDTFMDAGGGLTVSHLWRPLPFRTHREAGYLMELPDHMRDTPQEESIAQAT
jgi:hypothetical protein